MSSSPETNQPTRQQLAAQGRSAPGKVTGKLRKALDAMVWQGLKRQDAAKAAGLTEHALYCAFRRPHVKTTYLAELEVLRTSERARNIHRAIEIRDAANNKPAMEALKWLHQVDEQAQQVGGTTMPGFVIVLHPGDAPQVTTIEHDQLDQYDSGKQDQ